MSQSRDLKNEKMRQEAKSKIIKAALKVFAEYGFHGTTMNQITKTTKLSKGLVYHYFPSKEKLFWHLVDSALEISKRTWNGAFETPGSAWKKIQKLAENLLNISFTSENSRYYLIMLQAITQGKSIPGLLKYIQTQADHFNKLPEFIIQAQKAGHVKKGDPQVLTASFLAMIQGYTILLYRNKELLKKMTPEIFTSVFRK